MGFGIGPFGSLPYGLPAEDEAALSPAYNVSSRKIDNDGRFVVASDGGFEVMGDNAQRVLMATAFAARRSPLIDDQAQETTKQRIEEALAPLTDPKAPAIELLDVTVEDDGASTTFEGVRFKDLARVRSERKKPR